MTTDPNQQRVGGIRRVPDEPSLDATDLNWLIDQWLVHLAIDVLPYTLDGYRTNVRRFQRWWTKHGPASAWRLTRHTLKQFEYNLRGEGDGDAILNERSGEPLAWNTRNDTLRRLSEMLLWAQNKHYFTDSEAYHEWVPTPKGGTSKRKAATLHHLSRLHDACALAEWPARASAVIALLYDVGLRKIECVNLHIHEIQFHAGGAGVLIAHGKKTKANPTGDRQSAFDAPVGKLLQAYLDELNEVTGPMFRHIGDVDRPLGEKGIYYEVKRVIALAGLEDVLQACHDGRRNYVTHTLAIAPGNDAYADMVRRNLGHAHFTQTADYNLMSADDMVPILKSPLSRILESRSQPTVE